MHEVFGSAPLNADDWLLALGAAATVLPVVGAEKWWRRRDRSFLHYEAEETRQRPLSGELR